MEVENVESSVSNPSNCEQPIPLEEAKVAVSEFPVEVASCELVPTECQSTEPGKSVEMKVVEETPGEASAANVTTSSSEDTGITTEADTPEKHSPKLTEVVPFEEESRTSFTGESEPKSVLPVVKEQGMDDDSMHSIGSQKSGSAHKRKHSDDEANSSLLFPPENLFEYMWPQEKGEYYFLQEQISDYLNVKSFKRKYPDLSRRPADKSEKQFLKDRGVVNETQCELGLTALKSEDVLELMAKDYPDKYRDYIKVLREKEKQSITEKHKQYISSVDRNKMGEVAKKAIKSAAEYNAHLNQERKEERRCCFDLQTYTIHYPIGRNKKVETVKMGKYPLSLLPGQYQDGYKEYTPEELKYLPVNTVLYGPMQDIKNITQPMSDSSRSDSEESTGSENSCSSSQGTHDDGSGESSSSSEKNDKKESSNASGGPQLKSGIPYKPKDKPNAVCKVCKLKSGSAKDEKNESMVHCSVCDKSGHLSCLQLTPDMHDVLKTYPWQCMDCKSCSHCMDPYNEDKMLFCDVCDRGYHTFCVGLKALPPGKWICKLCGHCSVCNATQPGPEGSKAQWQYDNSVSSGSSSESLTLKQKHVVCQACSKRKR